MTEYKIRENSNLLISALKSMPVVVLSGMRQTGKSTLLQHLPGFEKSQYFTFDDFNTLESAKRNPEAFLEKDGLTIIDEAQKFPDILHVIKHRVDQHRKPGQFILSGSANFLLLKNITESLAGRAIYLTLFPFSYREVSELTRLKPALIAFLENGKFPQKNLKAPIHWKNITMGGMPSVCLGDVKEPKIWFRGYEQTYLERDVRSLSQVGDLVAYRNLLHLVALRNAQVLNQSDLARDAKLNVMTTSRYLSLMEASFVIYRLPPYLRNRSSRLIKSPKIYLTDTGLAAFLMGEKTVAEHELLKGFLWENYVLQNLQSILAAHQPDAQIFYWNIQGRHEVDFIIELEHKTLAIEVKYGSRIHEGDLAGLRAYLASSKQCLGGIVAYNGSEIVQLDKNIWAVPMAILLS